MEKNHFETYVRCSKEARQRFKIWQLQQGIENQGQALERMLDLLDDQKQTGKRQRKVSNA